MIHTSAAYFQCRQLEFESSKSESLYCHKNILNERKAWLFSTIGKKGKDPLMTLNNKNYHLKTLILNHDKFHLEMLKNHVNSACKAKTRQIIAHKNIIN